MPNIYNGMTGKNFIEEINSALDKRGNIIDETKPQEINGDLKIEGGLELKGGLTRDDKEITNFYKKDFTYEDLLSQYSVINGREGYKQIFYGIDGSDYSIGMISPKSEAYFPRIPTDKYYELSTLKFTKSGSSYFKLYLYLKYKPDEDKWLNSQDDSPIKEGQIIGKDSNSSTADFVIKDITEEYIEIDRISKTVPESVNGSMTRVDNSVQIDYSFTPNGCNPLINNATTRTYFYNGPKIEVATHYDRDTYGSYVLDYIRIFHNEFANKIRKQYYGTLYYN